jgi:metallo-beta-lactamase family protein
MSLKLTFHGAAGCVTGFCALLETDHARLLIDCGMFQGSKTLKALNYGDFPFDAGKIDAVLLTHAHIDHSGLLPKLMKAGFEGPIHATAGTRDLCEIMLADSASIQESEVRQLNRRNQRRGRAEVKPIYTVRDAARCIEQFSKVKLGDPVAVAPGITAIYWEAGHILGSSSIEVRVETAAGVETLLFSGDLGPGGRDYAPDPQGPTGVDYLILESTYGDRERIDLGGDARRLILAKELNDAHHAGGPLLIPAFAVERSQELLADLLTLMDDGQVPPADIFLDSPLAIEATEIFQRRGWNRETGTNPFQGLTGTGRLKFLREPGESDRLESLSGWHIILAASGMCDAGRVRKHLKRLLWRRQATVLLSGYQAAGTLGRILEEGAKRVSIQGEDIQVRARIRQMDVYSGHADAPGLVAWAKQRAPVAGVFLAHGEPASLEGLKSRLAAAGVPAAAIRIPSMDEGFILERAGAAPKAPGARRIAPDAAARADWHNARAQLLMELNQRLESAPDDKARERLIMQLAAALGGAAGREPSPKSELAGASD